MSSRGATAILSDQDLGQHFQYGFATATATVTPTPMESRPQMYRVWAQNQVSPLISLGENWDGYGASAPDQFAIALAVGFLAALGEIGFTEEPFVTPTRTGGVAFLWERENAELEVRCESTGQLHSFYENSLDKISCSGTMSVSEQNAREFFVPLHSFFRT
jgi:hypothetical protein